MSAMNSRTTVDADTDARVHRDAGFVVIHHAAEKIDGTGADEIGAFVEIRKSCAVMRTKADDLEIHPGFNAAQPWDRGGHGVALGEYGIGTLFGEPASHELCPVGW